VHLGMKGRWFVNAAHERRRPPPSETRVFIATSEHAIYCVRASTADLTRARDPKLRQRLQSLGPDVLAEGFDPAVAAKRAREHPDAMIAEVLLDQRVVAGIGNVYRSELLFITRVHPHKRVRELDDETLERLFALARDLMRANLGPGPRTTAGTHQGARHAPNVSHFYAYRRHGLPCHRCGAPIERELLGDLARSVYHCPRCQKQ
jgi:endonuclease VIII